VIGDHHLYYGRVYREEHYRDPHGVTHFVLVVLGERPWLPAHGGIVAYESVMTRDQVVTCITCVADRLTPKLREAWLRRMPEGRVERGDP